MHCMPPTTMQWRVRSKGHPCMAHPLRKAGTAHQPAWCSSTQAHQGVSTLPSRCSTGWALLAAHALWACLQRGRGRVCWAAPGIGCPKLLILDHRPRAFPLFLASLSNTSADCARGIHLRPVSMLPETPSAAQSHKSARPPLLICPPGLEDGGREVGRGGDGAAGTGGGGGEGEGTADTVVAATAGASGPQGIQAAPLNDPLGAAEGHAGPPTVMQYHMGSPNCGQRANSLVGPRPHGVTDGCKLAAPRPG